MLGQPDPRHPSHESRHRGLSIWGRRGYFYAPSALPRVGNADETLSGLGGQCQRTCRNEPTNGAQLPPLSRRRALSRRSEAGVNTCLRAKRRTRGKMVLYFAVREFVKFGQSRDWWMSPEYVEAHSDSIRAGRGLLEIGENFEVSGAAAARTARHTVSWSRRQEGARGGVVSPDLATVHRPSDLTRRLSGARVDTLQQIHLLRPPLLAQMNSQGYVATILLYICAIVSAGLFTYYTFKASPRDNCNLTKGRKGLRGGS